MCKVYQLLCPASLRGTLIPHQACLFENWLYLLSKWIKTGTCRVDEESLWIKRAQNSECSCYAELPHGDLGILKVAQ